MDQHVFLLQVHKEPELLKRLLSHLRAENHYFLVNVDRKAKVREDLLEVLEEVPNVIKISNFSVAHGGFSQVGCTVRQLRWACDALPEAAFFHTISGQDYPVCSNRHFDAVFHNSKTSYIKIDKPDELARWRKYKYPERIAHYYFWDQLQGAFWKKTYILGLLHRFSRYFTHRSISNIEKVWGGWSWFSLHREAVTYLLDKFDKNPGIMERCHYTNCVDELIFNSLLMQANDLQLVTDNCWRFIEWHPKRKCSSLPMILRETEYEQIVHTDALFVRKVSLPESLKLIDLLDKKIEKEDMFDKNCRP